MTDFLAFWTSLSGIVADFLLTEPINWFTGVFLLCAIVALVRRIIF